MFIRTKPRGISLVFLVMFSAVVGGQTANRGPADSGQLRQHYDAAQKFQRAGKLNEAAEQYRAFLADALGELAIGYALAPDYVQASPLFDEALALKPDSPSVLVDYARTALVLGDLDHAKTLATEFIQQDKGDHQQLAQAHQVLGRTFLKLERDQDARKEFEAAVALDPTFPNGYDLAVACLDLSDEKCAVQIFDEMEKSFGDTAEIHMAFGRAYAESDFQPRAVTEFRQAIQENPHLPRAHYLLAAVLLATGGDAASLQSAELELKKELAISPRDATTYAALGKIAVTRNQYPEAETYLKKAILLDPANPDAYLYLGQLDVNTDRPAEAETALRQCIRVTTDVSRNRFQVQKAHYLLGRILMKKGEEEAAHAEMTVSRELADKTLAQDKSKLAGLMDTSGAAELQTAPKSASASATAPHPAASREVEALKKQLSPVVADSFNNLGAIAATSSDYASALRYFKRAAAWDPSLDGLDYNWGRAAFAGSQFAEAVLPLSRYVKAHPEDAGARSVLGISDFMVGDYRGCVETLQSAIGKSDLVPQVEYVYAESLVQTGQMAPGMERLRALEKAHPEIPDVHRSLGEALNREGDHQGAREELRTAIQLNPQDADSHYELGKTELESRNAPVAISELEEAVRLLPASEKFHRELAAAYGAGFRPADARKEIELSDKLRASAQSGTTPSHQAPTSEP